MRNHVTPIAVAICGIFAISFMAYSAGPGTPSRLIPYRGHLEENGSPVTGTHTLTFHLYDDRDPSATTLTYSEDHSVDVVAGSFSVLLGSTNALPEAAFLASELYLGVDVDGTALPGLTQITAAPQAVRAGRAQDFDVADQLTSGTLLVSGETLLESQLRVQTGATDNAAAAGARGLFVSSVMGDGRNGNGGFEIRHDDLTQGIGMGFNTIYATGSNADQVLRLQSRGTSPLELNVGAGGTVEVGNNVNVSGVVRSACPPGTRLLAGWCMEENVRPASKWSGAMSACNDVGGQICSIYALMVCDTLAPPGMQCTTTTDQNIWTWTNSSQGNNVNAFFNIEVFNGDGNGVTNAIATETSEASLQYYCCLPGVLQ